MRLHASETTTTSERPCSLAATASVRLGPVAATKQLVQRPPGTGLVFGSWSLGLALAAKGGLPTLR
jgi:hypothetical protein